MQQRKGKALRIGGLLILHRDQANTKPFRVCRCCSVGKTRRLPSHLCPVIQGGNMSDTYSGEVYCVKCKAKREVTDAPVAENAKGRRMAKGTCPECGTTVVRILGKNQ